MLRNKRSPRTKRFTNSLLPATHPTYAGLFMKASPRLLLCRIQSRPHLVAATLASRRCTGGHSRSSTARPTVKHRTPPAPATSDALWTPRNFGDVSVPTAVGSFVAKCITVLFVVCSVTTFAAPRSFEVGSRPAELGEVVPGMLASCLSPLAICLDHSMEQQMVAFDRPYSRSEDFVEMYRNEQFLLYVLYHRLSFAKDALVFPAPFCHTQ